LVFNERSETLLTPVSYLNCISPRQFKMQWKPQEKAYCNCNQRA